MSLPENPETRVEQYLGTIAEQEGVTKPDNPESRVEQYLDYIIEQGTGGLPKATTAGTAVVWNGTKWIAQTGYGYSDSTGSAKIDASLLPSYVDDVVEYSSVSAFPATGESGKIYVALDTNKGYRWSGSTYTVVAPGPDVQEKLVSGTNIKTVNGTDLLGAGNVDVRTYQPYKDSWGWSSSSLTISEFCDAIVADTTATKGMAYSGTISSSSFFTGISGLTRAEVNVQVMGDNTKVLLLTCTSADVEPYHWELTYYNSSSSGWRALGGSSAVWGQINGTLSNQVDLQNALNAKQATLTAGSQIEISSNTISVTSGLATNGQLLAANGTGGTSWVNAGIGFVDLYTLMATLTNVTCTTTIPTHVASTDSLSLTFTPSAGYTLPSAVAVTGATYTWTQATGVLALSNAVGNVTITIVGNAWVSPTQEGEVLTTSQLYNATQSGE